jgi:hypothetical protein
MYKLIIIDEYGVEYLFHLSDSFENLINESNRLKRFFEKCNMENNVEVRDQSDQFIF